MHRYFLLAALFPCATAALAQELARADVYGVAEVTFKSSSQPAPSVVKGTEFWVRVRHQNGTPEYRIQGFWDGGDTFKIRFCPTQAGRWSLAEVHSNDSTLNRQKQGGYIMAQASARKGFWLPDPESPGSRWYRRSDGSHPYIFGNTLYCFLAQAPAAIARDIKANARYFRKARFSAIGDRYPDPATGSFLDGAGKATYDAAWSHRPNPAWFRERVDVAVATALDEDMIADLILAGPDLPTSRTSLQPAQNGGDPEPYLRYIAARYGAYPNVWICLMNEFNIKEPRYPADRIRQIGAVLRGLLPYPTPVSVHLNSGPWLPELNATPWNDHVIVQRKLKSIAPAADALNAAHEAGGGNKPAIDDELSYQGAGDDHTESDTLESHLGAFLGGGYGTTGHKASGPRAGQQVPKTGQYMTGNFNADEHSAARGLKWLRETIDARITFWKMSPGTPIFHDLDPGFRGMAWAGREYVLGTDKAARIHAALPPGKWEITSYDVIAQKHTTVLRQASGEVTFQAPASRAVLFHIRKSADPNAASVDRIFAAFDKPDSPGCALGIIRDGQFLYRKGYGMASLELGVPLTAQSVFYMGSVSKQFTAASVVLAAEQGLLSLDDNIRKHIPELPDYGRPITLRQMLHHTSGFRDVLALVALSGRSAADVHPTRELLDLVARQKALNYAPGAEYLYSNTNYFLAALAVGRAAKKPFSEFARENIFKPLGMTHTRFHDDHRAVVPGRIPAYSPGKDGGFVVDWSTNFDKVGDGGLMSSVDDLLEWDRNFYENRLGKGTLLREMQTRGVLNSGERIGYALGLTMGEYRGLPTVEHGGSLFGYRTELLRFPEQRFTVVCLCNLSTAGPGGLAHKVADLYLEGKMSGAASLRPAGPTPARAADWHPATAALAAYAGTYRSAELDATYRVSVDSGALVLRVGWNAPLSLKPVTQGVFEAGGLRLSFDKAGFSLSAGRVRNIAFEKLP